jgi:thioredoxin-related protein
MRLRLLALAMALLPFAPVSAGAAELLVFEQPGCPWCARFDAEIAPAWSKTAEGKRAPLRRVDITEPWPDDLTHIRKERFTPTFVLLDDGKEIGRLRGYVGDEFFWYLIGELLDQLPPADGQM